MRRLRVLLSSAVLAAAAGGAQPAALAGCGPDDPYDHPTYTFYWYECRRAEAGRPDLLPAIDPTSGTMTVCPAAYTGPGGDAPGCRRVNLMQGTAPSTVCLPAAPAPTPTTVPSHRAPCLPLPSISGSGDEERPSEFPYDEFRVCPPGGGGCHPTFHHACIVTSDGTTSRDLACAGAGVQFADPHRPERGLTQVCVAAGTPADPPGSWSIVCVPLSKVQTNISVRG